MKLDSFFLLEMCFCRQGATTLHQTKHLPARVIRERSLAPFESTPDCFLKIYWGFAKVVSACCSFQVKSCWSKRIDICNQDFWGPWASSSQTRKQLSGYMVFGLQFARTEETSLHFKNCIAWSRREWLAARKVHEAEELVWDGGLEIQFETHLVFVSLSYMIIVRLRVSRETRSSSNDLDSLAHGRRCFEKLRLVLLNS